MPSLPGTRYPPIREGVPGEEPLARRANRYPHSTLVASLLLPRLDCSRVFLSSPSSIHFRQHARSVGVALSRSRSPTNIWWWCGPPRCDLNDLPWSVQNSVFGFCGVRLWFFFGLVFFLVFGVFCWVVRACCVCVCAFCGVCVLFVCSLFEGCVVSKRGVGSLLCVVLSLMRFEGLAWNIVLQSSQKWTKSVYTCQGTVRVEKSNNTTT